jgi:coenzyme F420 biosynthesis associated uncharacterized protein
VTATIPWESAAGIAARLAGTHPLAESYHYDALVRQAPELVYRAADLVAAETGLEGDGRPDVAVIGRSEWVDRNLEFFAALLAPAEEAITERLGRNSIIGQRLVAAEMGALLGVLSRRVLGQYELVLPSAESGDTVYFVAPNILALERQHQFRPSEFRFWLALHEATHRLQFVGVPWMQAYFLSLVQELVRLATPDPGRLARLVGELRRAGADGTPLIGEAGVLGLFASPDQRRLIDKVQALMSLLEGHGHVVMDRIGARTLVTQKRMSNLLKARRKDPRMAAFMRITGMEMKMRQYELGEAFVKAVERRAGWDALDAAWEGPDSLPTRAEIEDPETWLGRVG